MVDFNYFILNKLNKIFKMIIIFKIADNYHNNKSMGKRKKTFDAKQTDSKNRR